MNIKNIFLISLKFSKMEIKAISNVIKSYTSQCNNAKSTFEFEIKMNILLQEMLHNLIAKGHKNCYKKDICRQQKYKNWREKKCYNF